LTLAAKASLLHTWRPLGAAVDSSSMGVSYENDWPFFFWFMWLTFAPYTWGEVDQELHFFVLMFCLPSVLLCVRFSSVVRISWAIYGCKNMEDRILF
jgi:hypothetical protein